MKPIVCVISTGILSDIIMEQAQSMNLGVDVILYEIELRPDTVLPEELNKVDVFLSSGYYYGLLKNKVEKPVINIEISLYDMMLAFSKAIEYDSNPVLITYSPDYTLLNRIQNILKFDMKQDSYDKLDNLEEKILKYKNAGYKCIIGSGLVCTLAKKHNLHSVFLFPKESIANYIKIAADLAITLNKELKKNEQMTSILNYAKVGIVITDNAGKFLICNPVAESIFNSKSSDILEQQITEYFPNGELNDILNIKETQDNIFVKTFGKMYIITAIPIINKMELENLVLFINDINTIQTTDRHIRHNLAQRGFVARSKFSNYSSNNKAFIKILATAKKFAHSEETIVISGETGTGKEIMAQAIHNESSRANQAFVAVNCNAINSNLLESELFGYDEGAFTGAKKGGKKGYFEMAHLGTIFLDEIGDIDLALQSKLLRVIQEKELIHVGGTKIIPFDARIIVATNKDLWQLVEEKKFREDLYYRLNILELFIIPLRERKEDIFSLFMNFFQNNVHHKVPNISIYAAEMNQLLCSYSWPGNVRELENFTRMLLATIELTTTPQEIYLKMEEIINQKLMKVESKRYNTNFKTELIRPIFGRTDDFQEIVNTLKETNGNQTEAAKLLGISRVTLWRKLKSLKESER